MGNNRFDNGDGTITDTATGLVWQGEDDDMARDWKKAQDYAKALALAGQTDWRVPTVEELWSLANLLKCGPASEWPGMKSAHYWSSSTYVEKPQNAWVVYFGSGSINFSNKNNGYRVRCVR